MAIPAEIRFKRYLCYTNEANIYYPGCRFFHGRYKPENVPSLEELIKENKQDYIFNTIKSMYEEKKTCYPDTLLFVLSRLIRVKEFRPQALELAELICVKSEPFFVFMKFCLEISPKMGFGRKFRKFVRNWYNKKEYLQLAEIVGKMKNYRGWNHGDLMKLSHVKVNDPAKACSVKYAVQGLEAMKKEFGDVPESKKVVEYLSTIEEYRTKTDAAEVAAKIDSYMLELGHINHVLHGDKLIWKSLLAQMPVAQVLQYFQHMSRKKMFRTTRNWDFIFVDTVIEALTKPFANRENVTVSKVFIEMMNYENAGRVKQELATKLKTTPKKPPILNADISNAFITLMDTVFKELKPTGKKIMIAIELSNEMLKRRCAVSRYVGLYEAAMFIAYYFRRLEENVKVFTFNPTAMKPLTINKEGTVKNAIEVYKSEDVPEVTDAAQKSKGDELITTWIKETGSKSGGADEVDVCIILKSYLDNNSLHTLVSSGAASKKLKFIVSDLCGIPKNSKPPDKRNLFVTSGFDEKLIEALAFFVSDVI